LVKIVSFFHPPGQSGWEKVHPLHSLGYGGQEEENIISSGKRKIINV
jgi:hypothetical protein